MQHTHSDVSILRHIFSPFVYGEPKLNDGYWGPVTATIDWCEENYVVSPYFAEIINATTNISFYFLSMRLLYSSIKNKHGLIFIFCSIGMCIVGIGSWLFHMTLRYEFQLLDELPMIYVTALPFAYIFSLEMKSNAAKISVYAITTIIVGMLTYIYCSVYKNPELHQISYGILNFAIIFRSVFLVKKYVTDDKSRWFLYKLVSFSLFEFLFGFLVWNLDTAYCSYLIKARRMIGLPFGALLLEGHGWWHILTSLGIFHFVIYNKLLKVWYFGKQDDYELIWKFGIPFEVRIINKDRINLTPPPIKFTEKTELNMDEGERI